LAFGKARQPGRKEVTQPRTSSERKQVPLLVWAVALALGLNVLAWAAASWRPHDHGTWTLVSVLGFFLLGLVIGRWWALLVTCAYGVLHAIPVYLGLLPGYLSTWGEALWWAFALAILIVLTGLGVLSRGALRWLRSRAASGGADSGLQA
jgi:hypothetical protein